MAAIVPQEGGHVTVKGEGVLDHVVSGVDQPGVDRDEAEHGRHDHPEGRPGRSIETPILRNASIVARQSSPSRNPLTSVTPSAMLPSMTAR